MYILTYSQNLTRVASNDLLLESDERPQLPFAFDALYFEPPTGLAFRVLAGEQIPLTAAEITICEAYCDAFLETADYSVFVYDETGVFIGSILKSEALQKGLAFTFPHGPDHPASKWTGEVWQKIAASILDDGSLILNPASICERCAMAFTADEWAVFPAVPSADNGEVWRWDFVKENWLDVSDPLVFAFDEADAYVGQHKRSLAQARGWGWHLTPPDGWPYKNTPSGWQRVEAVIYENGQYERLPGGIRNDAILLFTRAEWAAFPARPQSERGEIWGWDFVKETWEDISNPYGCAFEAGDNLEAEQRGLYAGEAFRAEAMARGLGFTLERPDHPASKWNGEHWQRIAAVLMDDGSVRENPEAFCDRCMVPLTASEWAAWPKPEREIPAALGGWNWNFAAGAWEDHRKDCELRQTLTQMVFWRHNAALNRLTPDPFEMEELRMALTELHGWLADATTGTPFVAVRYPDTDKSALYLELQARFAKLSATMGRLSAERAALLAHIPACADNSALDALYVQLQAEKTVEGVPCLRG